MRRLTWLVFAGLTGCMLAQQVEYEGPSILSRGVGAVLQGGGELARIRPYLQASGVYDTALTPVSVDENGNVRQVDVFGVQASAGVIGYHSWRQTLLSVDYRGNYRHYTNRTNYDGIDQILSLGVTHQVSRRVAFSLREAAGTYTRGFGILGGVGFIDQGFAQTPVSPIFDGRTYYTSSMGDLRFAKSSRMSFNIGGGGMFVRHRAQGLIGVTGAVARGDMAYRLNESSTIGLDYYYTHYTFTNSFGGTDLHGVAFDYAVRLGRSWQFGLRGGATRVESLGLRRVAIDPVIAAILGQTSGIEVFYRRNYIPHGSVRLSHSFRRSTAALGYSMGAGYGNGVYLTSRSNSAYGSYSISGSRKWNIGISASYHTFSSLSTNIGKYHHYSGGAGFTYQVLNMLHMVARFDALRYDIRGNPLRREGYRVSLGFALSPGEFPLSLW